MSLQTPPDTTPSSPTSQTPKSYIPTPKAVVSYKDAVLNLADSFTSTISTLSFPPLVAASRMAIVSMMSQSISYGRLRVLTTDHGIYEFGADESDAETADIRVLRDSFWLRLVTLGDLGFAEAYMAGDCEVSDLVQVFKIFIRSRPALESTIGPTPLPTRIFSLITSLTNTRFANTISNSLSNIRAHYDLSNAMFAAFLSKDMTYSCAIFPELDTDLKGVGKGGWESINGGGWLKRLAIEGDREDRVDTQEDELEEAQLAKLRHMIRKADIRPGHRVLEIGSGWGSFAIETKCTVDTITLSASQKALAEERIKAAGFAGRIRVWLLDYRNLPESWKGQFDRVVSIEMLEAVGIEFTQGYFKVIESMLNAKGAACVQVITIPESRFEKYKREVDFIRKWIFPGGFLPTVTFVMDAIQQGGSNRLVVDSVSNIGPHYARTLREWRRRFLSTFQPVIRPALQAEHPEMTDGDVEVFRRKWIYYFCYCEVGFTERVIGDHIFTMVREGNAEYGCTTFD